MPLQSRRRFLCQSAALAAAACHSQVFSSDGGKTRATTEALNNGRSPVDTTIASVLDAGLIGRLREVICWSQAAACPKRSLSGEAAFRLRGGQLLNGPFAALNLKTPAMVYGAGSAAPGDAFPRSMAVRYEFEAHRGGPGLVLTWYDGEWAPPYESIDGLPLSASGTLYLGQNGQLLHDGISGRCVLMRDGVSPRELRPAGLPCDGAVPTDRHVDASIVAGIVSYCVRHSVEWDGAAMCVRNSQSAEALFRDLFDATVEV